MADLTHIAPKLAPLVRMMGSSNDGETLGAARALGRVLARAGASFHDLADRIEHEPAPLVVYRDRPNHSARDMREAGTLQHLLATGILSDWETRFVVSILARMRTGSTWRASPKQRASIDLLLAKAEAMGVAI